MKFTFGMQINIDFFYKLILSFWVRVTRYAQSTENKKFGYVCNISRKVWEMKLIFWLQINTKIFYKSILSLWVCIARPTQSTQSNNFTISLLYLIFSLQRFLQIDTIILGVCGQACPNYPK